MYHLLPQEDMADSRPDIPSFHDTVTLVHHLLPKEDTDDFVIVDTRPDIPSFLSADGDEHVSAYRLDGSKQTLSLEGDWETWLTTEQGGCYPVTMESMKLLGDKNVSLVSQQNGTYQIVTPVKFEVFSSQLRTC